MRVTGYFKDDQYTREGKCILSLLINEVDRVREWICSLKPDEKYVIVIKKFRDKRSNKANAYFWQLVGELSTALENDKWTIYLLQLTKYGLFIDVKIDVKDKEKLKTQFRYVEFLSESENHLNARCYIGSSNYDTKAMSDLIKGTVQDAKDMGIETATPDEIQQMLQYWKPEKGVDGY